VAGAAYAGVQSFRSLGGGGGDRVAQTHATVDALNAILSRGAATGDWQTAQVTTLHLAAHPALPPAARGLLHGTLRHPGGGAVDVHPDCQGRCWRLTLHSVSHDVCRSLLSRSPDALAVQANASPRIEGRSATADEANACLRSSTVQLWGHSR